MSEQFAEHPGIDARPRLSEGWLEAVAQALPLGIVLGIVAFMIEREGGFALTVWSPIALLLLGVVATTVFSAGHVLAAGSRTTFGAIGCLAAFTLWSFLTIVWSGVRGDAWDGSNRTLLYVLVFALVASWPATARAVWPLLLLAGLLVAIEGARDDRADDPCLRPDAVPDRFPAVRASRLPECNGSAVHDHGLADDRPRLADVDPDHGARPGLRSGVLLRRPQPARREPRVGVHAAARRSGLLHLRPGPPPLARGARAGRARPGPGRAPGDRRLQRRRRPHPANPPPRDRPCTRLVGRCRRRRLRLRRDRLPSDRPASRHANRLRSRLPRSP